MCGNRRVDYPELLGTKFRLSNQTGTSWLFNSAKLGLNLGDELRLRPRSKPLYSRATKIAFIVAACAALLTMFKKYATQSSLGRRDLLIMFWPWFLARRSVYAARIRFFVHVRSALWKLYDHDHPGGNKVGTLDHAGRAARALFIYLQGSRLTWKPPPVVADRAFRLAYPLINVELTPDFKLSESGRRELAWFLHDVVAVVHMGMSDLAPGIRSLYPGLPTRHHTEDDIPERDLLYLDPMRNMNRWGIVRDYMFPLAA
jgi:hypothetical protein